MSLGKGYSSVWMIDGPSAITFPQTLRIVELRGSLAKSRSFVILWPDLISMLLGFHFNGHRSSEEHERGRDLGHTP